MPGPSLPPGFSRDSSTQTCRPGPRDAQGPGDAAVRSGAFAVPLPFPRGKGAGPPPLRRPTPPRRTPKPLSSQPHLNVAKFGKNKISGAAIFGKLLLSPEHGLKAAFQVPSWVSAGCCHNWLLGAPARGGNGETRGVIVVSRAATGPRRSVQKAREINSETLVTCRWRPALPCEGSSRFSFFLFFFLPASHPFPDFSD